MFNIKKKSWIDVILNAKIIAFIIQINKKKKLHALISQ